MRRVILALTILFVIHTNPTDSHAQLSCLRAVVRSANSVDLRWTCMPIPWTNYYGSSIFRRNETEPVFFELMGSFCPGASEEGECVFVDNTVSPGVWFYRVRMIDLDGTVSYSDTLRVFVGTTGVEEGKPSQFVLHQNYPNPFNPTTHIEYAIPRTSHVSLKVFDVLGREVATLVDEVQGSGFKSVEFDASGLTSGVYFYSLKAGDYLATKRMLLIK